MDEFPCVELFKKGICKADCCGCVGIDKEVFEKNKHKIQRKIEEQKEFDGEIHAITEDGICVFNKPDHTCAIYSDRPEVCKKYGTIPELLCPYIDFRGKLRTPAKVRRYKRIIDKDIDRKLKNLENFVKNKHI